jgi:uncharacterized membrane protein YphA (DoxX/SURF4 family)
MTKEHSCSQIRLLTRITALACLTGMCLSYNLWLGERKFPVTPIIDFLYLHHPYDLILPVISAILLLCILFFRNPQRFIIGFVISAVLLGIMDMNRWQPWFYQYILIFFILSSFNFRCDDTRHQQSIIVTFKVMIAAIYFWSGLQKLNPHFLSDIFPWLMEPVLAYMKPGSIDNFKFLGYAFPLVETGTGICLLIPSLKKPAVIMATIMHVFILFVLSPLGHNYNPVVWPWNVAMILFAFILFFHESAEGVKQLKSVFQFNSTKIVIGLFVMMPLLNFFNLWDSYLSHNLYSGNTSNGIIYLSENVKNKLPVHIKKYVYGEPGNSQINIKYWCIMETGVPPYPEKRNFDAAVKEIYSYASDPSEVYLLYTPKLKMNQK